jgi:DNA polymerase-3 subunit delta
MAKIRSRDVAAKYEQIASDLKKKIYRPVYLLMGEELYYIDMISAYIADNVLSESEKSFNQVIMYGKDTDARSIVFAAARPPMMSNYQVVIVREAQNIKKLDELEAYLKFPLTTTILVICYKGKSVDKRIKVYKEIEKHGEILETAKLYENEIASWVTNYLKQKGCTIDPAAAGILADFIGNDLSRIASELDKLFTLLPVGNNQITVEHIEKNIGISKEYNTFELNNAIMKKNVPKAFQIVDYFSKNQGNNLLSTAVSALFSQFSKVLKLQMLKHKYAKRIVPTSEITSVAGIEPYFLKDYEDAALKYPAAKIVRIIELLREYDMRGKGWNNAGTPDSELLRELVFKIMN